MNDSVFQSNLQALHQTNPPLALLVRNTPLDGIPAEIVKTKTNLPSLKWMVSNGKPQLLHSAYDPMREARRWAESVTIDEPTNIFIFGCGLGYHLMAFLEQHIRKSRFVFIVEKDPRLFRLTLSVMDLRPVIQRKGTFFIVGEKPEDIPEIVGDRRTDIALHNYRVFPHDPSWKCFPEYYAAVQKHLIDAITYDEVNLRTNVENRGRNQFNLFMNLPNLLNGYALKDCKNLFQGYPGIVAAAGPSLDKNIHHLRGLHGRAPLIAVDTLQTTLKKQGIEPDFVVTADPTELNFSHFDGIDTLGQAFLAFHPEVNRKITNKFIRHPFQLPLYDGGSDMLEHVVMAKDRYGTIERAMNVGHIAVHLALHLGCSPIVLVGFDFAFPPKGGTTHVKDAAVSRAILDSRSDGTTTIGGKEGRAIEETGKMYFVPGYYGEPVPTTVPFQQYILAIEKTIAEHSVPFIDATEGGAAFHGTSRMPLEETLSQVLQRDGFKQRIDEFRGRKTRANVRTMLERLKEGREVLFRGKELCTILLKCLDEWRTRLASGPIELSEAKQRWKEFDRQWVEMVSPPLFDGFLGTSPQYIYFKRQRSEDMSEKSGTEYLTYLADKYDYIVGEMDGLLESFIHTVELAEAALKVYESEGIS